MWVGRVRGMTTGRFHSEPTPSAHSLLSDSRPSGVVCDALGTCKGRAQPTRIALIAPWSPPPPVGAPINLHRVGTRDRDAFPITSNSASIQSSKSHPSALPRSSYSSYARCRIFCWISCADTTGCFPEMGVGCRFFIVVFPLFRGEGFTVRLVVESCSARSSARIAVLPGSRGSGAAVALARRLREAI